MNIPEQVQRPDTRTLFEKLFTSSPDGIVVVGRNGNILETNPQIESMFGYAAGELRGSPIEILIPERLRPGHEAHRANYGQQPRIRPMGSGFELYGRRKDGSEFPVDIMLSPLDTSTGPMVLAVIRDVTERKQIEEEMRKLISTDALTGLGNYRCLQQAFDTESKWFQRTSRPCALLLMDLDALKKINDTRGHLAGSRVLCRLADVLRAECRAVDTPARHGGDEFAVVLPDTTAEGAANLARRLAARLASDGEDPPVSFSYGVAVCPGDGKTLNELLAAADRPLYEMKKTKL